MMRTRALVHQHALQVVPDAALPSLSIGCDVLAHVDLQRIGDRVLRLAPLERFQVENKAQDGEVKYLRTVREAA